MSDTTTTAPAENGQGERMAIEPRVAFRRDIAAMTKELEAALARRIPVDHFQRVLMTTVQRTPRLLECSRLSLLGAVMESAQLGLLPDGVTGYGYIVPRWNNKTNRYEAAFQPGYKGLVQLAYRGGTISKVVGREVRERDEFRFRLGTTEEIVHVPSLEEDRGEITHFYAVAWQRDGSDPIFVVLPKSRVDELRDRATRAAGGKMTPAWSGDYVAMGRKTAVRELFRWLPLDHDAQRAAAKDEADELEPRDAEAEVKDTAPRRGGIDDLLREDDGPEETGGVDVRDPEGMSFVPCGPCGGTGETPDRETCETCGGSGDVPAPREAKP